MAKKKSRECYGTGSVSAITSIKKDRNGNVIIGADGKPLREQDHDKDGCPIWRVCVTVGVEKQLNDKGKLTRKQKRITKRFHGTLRAARAYAKELSESYSQVDTDTARGNFSSLIQQWKDSTDHSCSEKQLAQYVRHLEYLAPMLDEKPLIELKRPDVESALKAVDSSRSLSATTFNKVLQITKRVFEYAIDCDYIVRNPCRGIRPRRYSQSESASQRKSLSKEEAARLRVAIDNVEDALIKSFIEKEARQLSRGNAFGRKAISMLRRLSYIFALRLLLATGARRGEVLALTWGNLDLDNGTMRISRSLNETRELRSPKSDAGIRNLFVDGHTLAHLRTWRDIQMRCIHLLGKTVDEDTFVFVTDEGTMCDPTNYSSWWSDNRESLGCAHLLTHELRHTHVTLLRGEHITEEMIQSRVGHQHKGSVTYRYTHETPANDREAAEAIERILYGSVTTENGFDAAVIDVPLTA